MQCSRHAPKRGLIPKIFSEPQVKKCVQAAIDTVFKKAASPMP
jgi:hypothetical protein